MSSSFPKQDQPKSFQLSVSEKALPANTIDVHYVTDDEHLQSVVEELQKTREIAVDLEFDDNRFSYGRTISLIQLFDGEAAYLVDALLIEALQPLLRLLEDATISKLFHSCASDLHILNDVANCSPKNIEDTSLIYTLFLETKNNISLSKALEEKAGIHMKKQAQSSNWVKRPLSESQLEYAAYDVVYLPYLRQILLKELEKLNRVEWYEQERKVLENIRYELRDPMKRLARKHKFSKRKTAILYAYWEVVDELASQLNKPHYRVMDNKTLVALVEYPPRSREDWMSLKGFHPRLKRQPYLGELMDARKQAEQNYQKQKEALQLQGQLPNAMKWRGYKRNHVLLAERGELFDTLRMLMAEEKGEEMQSLIFPSKLRNTMIWEGFSQLTPWKIEQIESVVQAHQIDLSPLQFSLVNPT